VSLPLICAIHYQFVSASKSLALILRFFFSFQNNLFLSLLFGLLFIQVPFFIVILNRHILHFVHASQDVMSQYLYAQCDVWPYSQGVKYSLLLSLLQNRVVLHIALNLCAQISNYVCELKGEISPLC